MPRRAPGRVRVFSANLLEGRADASALAGLLRSLDVDVAAFQEFSAGHADSIAEVLPHGALGLPRGRSMGLALRYPGRVESIRLARRNAHFAVLQPEHWPQLSAPLEVVTTHIGAPHQWPPWKVFPGRRDQVRGLRRHIETSPQRARVLVGDLNATPIWPAYRRLTELMDDAALQVARRTRRTPRPTWSPRLWGPRLLRLDHGLVQGVEVHDFRVIPVAGSDHAGILLDVSPA